MKLGSRRNFKRILIAGTTLFLVQLACAGGVAPTDPRIPESLNNMVNLFNPFLAGLQSIPLGGLQPPLITQITSNSVSGLGSIGAVGSGVIDATGVGSPELSNKVRLYRMQLRGCEKEPDLGELLAETSIDFGGSWTINYSLRPGEVVGATQVLGDEESGLSNLKVNIDEKSFMELDKEYEIQQIEYNISQPLIITGKSIPGACIVLLNMDGRVASATTDDVQKWEMNLSPNDTAIKVGENKLKIYVKYWEEINKEFVINGFFPSMHWPIGKNDDSGKYVSDFSAKVTSFYGKNDYYVFYNILNGFHAGIDIDGGSETDPVLAVAEGDVFYIHVVSGINGDLDGGNIVFIDHGAWFSAYLHLSKITIANLPTPEKSTYYDPDVKKYHVLPGDKIGESGNTGVWKCVKNCEDSDPKNNVYEPCCEHLHFSAFKWIEGNRQLSIKNKTIPPFRWHNYGIALNVNPPRSTISGEDVTLSSGEKAFDRLRASISDFDYWLLNWKEIPVQEFGCPSGTKFEGLKWGVVDEETKEEGWICK